jgi:hypothetical protein
MRDAPAPAPDLLARTAARQGLKFHNKVVVVDGIRFDSKPMVEDVKGASTPQYRIKRKLLPQFHGIEVKGNQV